MALWVCGGEAGCSTKYAVGLFRCPRCHNTEFYEDGDPMAKITRHGGASDATLPATEPEPEATDAAQEPEAEAQAEHQGEHGPELLDPASPDADDEGGEESSPGSSSSASTEKPQPNSEPSSKTRQRRARTTGSRFAKDQTENSSATGTAGGQETGTSAADAGE